MGDISVSVSIPLDSDGFLRRECPHCELEFKVFVGDDEEDDRTDDDTEPVEGYCCPYCGKRAPADAWYTKAQLEVGEAALSAEMDKMIERELGSTMRNLERASGGLIKASVSSSGAKKRPRELEEADDMLRVDFDCHADVPLKVVEDWVNEVHCYICGTTRPAPELA
jgi:hypothetical protein